VEYGRKNNPVSNLCVLLTGFSHFKKKEYRVLRPGKYEKEKVLSIKHSLYLFDTIQGKCEQNVM